ncbi:MAG: zinc metallopeptidase [Victivallales bacterium]|nr:zinc metallopeptidase [Victivallales bacterium]
MFYIDPLYILFALPGLILSLLASFFVKSTFGKYSQVMSRRGLTGAEAARMMLERQGITDVAIDHASGFLGDHYDPSCKTLRLSADVYGSSSISAIGVACHEAGHAIQHATGYSFLALRSALVPVASIGSNVSYFIFLAGFIFQAPFMLKLGCLLFAMAVLFTIVTLPVEWDASARAKAAMVQAGFLSHEEENGAASVLNAAFMTYVAGAVSALMTLLYYMMRAGLLGRRDD